MVFSIQPHEGRWRVCQDDMPIFSAGYRQVEDWLDWAENSGGLQSRPSQRTSSDVRVIGTKLSAATWLGIRRLGRAGKCPTYPSAPTGAAT